MLMQRKVERKKKTCGDMERTDQKKVKKKTRRGMRGGGGESGASTGTCVVGDDRRVV